MKFSLTLWRVIALVLFVIVVPVLVALALVAGYRVGAFFFLG